jgi:chromosome segregation ATPase
MFETLKTLTLGPDAPAAKAATAELIKLTKFAREQKTMLEAALNQVETRSAGLMQTAKSLERVEKRAVAAGGRLDDLDEQVNTLVTRVQTVDEAGPRVEAVTRRAEEAESLVARLLSPEGDLQRLRESLQRLEAEAAENRAGIEALKKERSQVDEVRTALAEARKDAAAGTNEVKRLRTELESLRALTPDLRQEYDRLRAAALDDREYADTVMSAVAEIEKKIGALTALDEMSKSTEERLAGLNSLSEHVSLKVKALEGQRGVVERALVESNRLNELVWSMDAQIAKLADGAKHVTKTEELLDRLERLSAETSADLEAGAKAKDELTREIAKTHRDSKEFGDFARNYLERIDLARKEADALGQRLSSLNSGMGDVESRLETASASTSTRWPSASTTSAHNRRSSAGSTRRSSCSAAGSSTSRNSPSAPPRRWTRWRAGAKTSTRCAPSSMTS